MSAGPGPQLEVLDDCWNRIGVGGDRSCPELRAHVHCRNCPTFADAARTFFDRPAPPGYLADWTHQLAFEEQVGEGEILRLLVFRLGGEWLAIDVRALAEVTSPRPIHRVPHRTDDRLVGLVNIRGQLHLCASLHAILGVGPSDDPEEEARSDAPADRLGAGVAVAVARRVHPRLIVLQDGPARWAFAADDVLYVRRVPSGRLGGIPATVARAADSFSRAIFELEGRQIGLLDPGRILAALRSLGP